MAKELALMLFDGRPEDERGMDGVCTADRFRARLRGTEVQNFSLVDEIFDRTGDVFDGPKRISHFDTFVTGTK